MEQVVQCTASVLAPAEPEQLKAAYVQVTQPSDVPEAKGHQLLEALAQTYDNVDSWGSRRQILSIMADTHTQLANCDSLQVQSSKAAHFSVWSWRTCAQGNGHQNSHLTTSGGSLPLSVSALTLRCRGQERGSNRTL